MFTIYRAKIDSLIRRKINKTLHTGKLRYQINSKPVTEESNRHKSRPRKNNFKSLIVSEVNEKKPEENNKAKSIMANITIKARRA